MSHTLRPRSVLLGLSLLAVGAVLPPRSALACRNSMAMEEVNVATLVQSEDDLAHGKPGAAVQRTLQSFPDLKTVKGGDRLMTRAQRVMATAIVRMDGLLAVRGFDASTCAERRANLEWAVAALRYVDRLDPNRPIIQSELAEALSALPEHQEEAARILEDLARREVMPSPYGFRALARLRRWAGDAAGERDALNESRRLQRPPPPDDPAASGF